MSNKRVADLVTEVLAEAGVRRIYGLSGDSLNGITDSIRVRKDIEWIHVRHEETAAFAAGAEAHLTGSLAVCAGSCGPGNLHLINGLYDCHRNRVPVLAIAAQIPSTELGSNYFQETHPEHLFAQCSHYCELVSEVSQMPRVLEIAMQTAISRRGVSVIALPGDIAMKEALVHAPRVHYHEPSPTVCPSDEELNILADLLNRSKKVTILGGAGCAGAHAELIEFAGKLQAPIVHALRGKEFIEYDKSVPMRRVDRPARILFRLLRNDELRCTGNAWNGLSLSAVSIPRTQNHRSNRPSRRTDWPPQQG